MEFFHHKDMDSINQIYKIILLDSEYKSYPNWLNYKIIIKI